MFTVQFGHTMFATDRGGKYYRKRFWNDAWYEARLSATPPPAPNLNVDDSFVTAAGLKKPRLRDISHNIQIRG